MAGYEVVEASNAEDGLERFREDPVDLVVTDIFMPERGGLEVIRELRRDFPALKIIAISGVDVRDEIDMVALTTRYGADRALEKPLSQEQLLGAVKELLD
ncbi:MAG: response regulator [bacterium]|nr:response regulator [bacterium]